MGSGRKKADPEIKFSTVEVAHEAVFRSWPRLTTWISEEKFRLEALRDLEDAARTWDQQARHRSYLDHRNERLERAENLASSPQFLKQINQQQTDYIVACRQSQLIRRYVSRFGLACLIAAALSIVGGIANNAMMIEARTNATQLVRGGYPSKAAKYAIAGALSETDLASLFHPNAFGDRELAETGFTMRVRLQFPEQFSIQKHQLTKDGRRLLVVDEDGAGSIWDLENAVQLASVEDVIVAESYLVQSQNRLILKSNQGALSVWDLARGDRLTNTTGKIFNSISLSEKGGKFALLSEDNTCSLWDIKTGKLIGSMGPGQLINYCSVADVGDRVLTRTIPFRADLWSSPGKPVEGFPNNSECYTCGLSILASRFYLVDTRGQASLYDLRTGALVENLPSNKRVLSIVFAPDGETFIARSIANELTIYDAQTGKKLADLGNAAGENVSYDPSGKLVLVRGSDGSALLKKRSGDNVHTFAAQSIKQFSFSRKGERLATITFKGEGFLWSTNGEQLAQLGKEQQVQVLVFSEDGSRLSVSSTAAPGGIWDSESGKQLVFYEAPGADGGGMFTSNGRRYVAASQDNYAVLWDPLNGKKAAFLGGEGAAAEISIADDDKTVLVKSVASAAIVFDYSQIVEVDKPLMVRQSVCDLNYDQIRPFDPNDVNGPYPENLSARQMYGYVHGRPWHPCDWKGLLSLEGWLQAARYWLVKAGLPFNMRAEPSLPLGVSSLTLRNCAGSDQGKMFD